MMDLCVVLYYYAEVRLYDSTKRKQEIVSGIWRYNVRGELYCQRLCIQSKSMIIWHKFTLDLVEDRNEANAHAHTHGFMP